MGKSIKQLPRSPFPPGLAFFLDNPIRRLLINRKRFLRDMGVQQGDYVLEVGCGPGFFTTVLSDIVGERGMVYAQDVEKRMIERVKKKLKRMKNQNVIPLLCNSSALEIPDNSCDVAFCANVFEEIYKEGDLKDTVKDIDRVLKHGGILIIKEHRLGGTEGIMRETMTQFIIMGYKKVFEEKTFLSYYAKLKKS